MLGGIFLTRDMVRTAADLTGLDPDLIMGRSRIREAAYVRFAIWHALHNHGLSYSQIGRRFGRDHSSVLEGCRRAAQSLDDPEFARLADALERAHG